MQNGTRMAATDACIMEAGVMPIAPAGADITSSH